MMILDDDGGLAILLLGPAGATGFYWMLYRYYRNTDKSHDFEHETAIVAKPVEGADGDRKVGVNNGTRDKRISGDNVHEYRKRVQRLEPGGS
jgi:hypothetical protein